jgi:hypothetical protein
LLIGLAAVALLYFNGRIAGIGGIMGGVLRLKEGAGKLGLWGQAPSDHPDFATFLVRTGIDSISFNPDSFLAVKRSFAEVKALRFF